MNIYKRVVIKIGTSILAPKGELKHQRIKPLVSQIANLVKAGVEVVIVTSGAVGSGMGKLGIGIRPKNLPQQQACASIGQSSLMHLYEVFFKKYNLKIGQILLTRDDIANRRRYLNARNTFFALLKFNAVPIVNENDTVSVDEIKFGDNDLLSALVANLVDAQLLIILSDVDGLYNNATKELIRTVERITKDIEMLAGTTQKQTSIGGMSSKLEAAKIVTASGIPLVIANGNASNILPKIVKKDEYAGTYFKPRLTKLTHKKRWIAFTAKTKGALLVDEGAIKALVKAKKSLLPTGITGCLGNFATGDLVSIADKNKNEFARGLSNYSSEELAKIKGLKSDMIEKVLGYKNYDEVIHRDNLVIL